MTEKELQTIFSVNIKKYRSAQKLSQVQLAKKAGVSVNFINDLESGKKWVSPVSLVKLADALKIEAYELLKPPGMFPDNIDSIIREYTENIRAAVEQVHIDFVHAEEKFRKQKNGS